MNIEKGQVISLSFPVRDRNTSRMIERLLAIVVIDPDGLGEGRPLIGLLCRQHLSEFQIAGFGLEVWIAVPENKVHRIDVQGSVNPVIEVCFWVSTAIATLKLKKPGKDRQSNPMGFLNWYSVLGLYSDAYLAFGLRFGNGDRDRLLSLISN